ncbi:MAG: ATP-binding cassette domain-containing protein [Shewanella sp.]
MEPQALTSVAVQAVNVSKRYGHFQALSGINFELLSGQTLALLGHNGAGKSTLLKLILGLITPTTGQLQVQGQMLGAHPMARRLSIGYLPENVSFYDNMTALELLSYFAKLKGVAPTKAQGLLDEFGLGAAKHQRLGSFSKGMRQRLGLAQALLAAPKVLLLDEPTVGLDPIASAFLYQKIAELKAQGCAVMISTHELGLVQNEMDRALILGQGQLLASGHLAALRAATGLPMQVALPHLSAAQYQQVVSDALLSPLMTHTQHQGVRLCVPLEAKSAVIQQLLQRVNTTEFSVEPPSLQDIFHFYMGQLDLPLSQMTLASQDTLPGAVELAV